MENTRISRERFFCQAALLGVAYGTARYRNVPITRQAALPFAFSTIFQLGSLHLKGSPNKKTYANLLSAFSFALMADGLRKLDMPVRSKVLSGGILGGVQLVIVNYSLPERTGSLPRERDRQAQQPTNPLTSEVGVQPQVEDRQAQQLSPPLTLEVGVQPQVSAQKLSLNEWHEKLLSSNKWLEKLFEIYFERFNKKNSRKFDIGNGINFAKHNEKFLQKKKEEFDNRLICGPNPERPRTIQRFSQLLHDKLINNEFPYETPEQFWERFANEPLNWEPWIVPNFIKTKEDFQYFSEIKLPEDQRGDFKQCDVVKFSDLPSDQKESFKINFIDFVSHAKDTRSEAMQIYLTQDLRELHCIKFVPGGKMEGVYLCKNTILLTYKDVRGEFSSSRWTLDFNNCVFELNQVEIKFDDGLFELAIKLFKPVGQTV